MGDSTSLTSSGLLSAGSGSRNKEPLLQAESSSSPYDAHYSGMPSSVMQQRMDATPGGSLTTSGSRGRGISSGSGARAAYYNIQQDPSGAVSGGITGAGGSYIQGGAVSSSTSTSTSVSERALSAAAFAREVERTELLAPDSEITAEMTALQRAKVISRSLLLNLCRCRWPTTDMSKWRNANHQYQRAPPNTTLQEFLDMSNRESDAETTVTVLQAPASDTMSGGAGSRLTKHALFSDEPASAVQTELENGDDSYFHQDDEEVIAQKAVEDVDGDDKPLNKT
ncbi:unnamed protein product [Amoebophrya sp. A25]|nr:unnamed protein product [Amoebophrya sp. A25]|eukprot:GSA25T00017882001.1